MKNLECCGKENCTEEINYIDHKGFIYCESHGLLRQQSTKCRKLRSHEIKRLKSGHSLKKY